MCNDKDINLSNMFEAIIKMNREARDKHELQRCIDDLVSHGFSKCQAEWLMSDKNIGSDAWIKKTTKQINETMRRVYANR